MAKKDKTQEMLDNAMGVLATFGFRVTGLNTSSYLNEEGATVIETNAQCVIIDGPDYRMMYVALQDALFNQGG